MQLDFWALDVHWWLMLSFSLTAHLSPSPWRSSQFFLHSCCPHVWNCPNSRWRLYTSPCSASQESHGLVSQSLSGSLWMLPFLTVCLLTRIQVLHAFAHTCIAFKYTYIKNKIYILNIFYINTNYILCIYIYKISLAFMHRQNNERLSCW